MKRERMKREDYEPCKPEVRNGDFIGWVKLILKAAAHVYKKDVLKKP